MSLRDDIQALIDRADRHLKWIVASPSSNVQSVMDDAEFATDWGLLDEETRIFRAGTMSPELMVILKGRLQEIVEKHVL